ncbi:MAG: hypothetical protein HOV80_07720 [Polyangiaceae bacterium]|nr:hypothetical protein [Polyangiaceae bacterium]
MKWASVTKGNRARKKDVEFTPLDRDEPLQADLRVLDGKDHGKVLAFAAAYAEQNGGKAVAGDERYDYGKDIQTVLLALTDSDSPGDRPEPVFGSIDELFEALDRDRICALASQQRFYQDVTSPFPFSMTAEEFAVQVADLALAEEGELHNHPFVKWPPGWQLLFTHSLACRLLSYLQLNSPTSSASEPAGS